MFKIFTTLKAYSLLIWHLLKVFFQLIRGVWKISRLRYAPITIFGGTHLHAESVYIKKAQLLARKLAAQNIPVLTGGGPGIMEAASCGAYGDKEEENIISTMGIGVTGLIDEKINKCLKHNIMVDYFFARKWLLVEYSAGFAVFPGGFGTLDELAELLTLIQTKQRKPAPIVLIGDKYWNPLIYWINNCALKEGLIKEEDAKLFRITDDVEEAFKILNIKNDISIQIDSKLK